MSNTRICRICGVEKNAADFYGRRKECKPCHNARSRENYLGNSDYYKALAHSNYVLNREERLIKQRAYHAAHPEDNARRCREWKEKNIHRWKEIQERGRLKHRYKITPEGFDILLSRQDNKCAVCFSLFKNSKDRHIDHDHINGSVRAVLCKSCNLAEGHLKTSDTALKMYQYMLKHETKETLECQILNQ